MSRREVAHRRRHRVGARDRPECVHTALPIGITDE